MSIKSLNEKIAKQQEKLQQLKSNKQALEAKERKQNLEQQKKDETRKKILLGAFLLKEMSESDVIKQKILGQLNDYLTEERDRKLFGL